MRNQIPADGKRSEEVGASTDKYGGWEGMALAWLKNGALAGMRLKIWVRENEDDVEE